ncbi:MAG: hypothetical protein AAGG51_30975 [Cyanobacteria bacterium P01_G01_bin.54]
MASSIERVSSPPETSVSSWRRLKSGLAKVGAYLLRLLAPTQEPVISQHCDSNGNLTWKIYDPHSNQTYGFANETEVRQWLDSRYYGNPISPTTPEYTPPPQTHQKAHTFCEDDMTLDGLRQQLLRQQLEDSFRCDFQPPKSALPKDEATKPHQTRFKNLS